MLHVRFELVELEIKGNEHIDSKWYLCSQLTPVLSPYTVEEQLHRNEFFNFGLSF